MPVQSRYRDERRSHGKPPEHRFKKGEVANPHGRAGKLGHVRRKRREELASLLREELSRKRRVEIGGKVTLYSNLQLYVRRIVADAASGMCRN